MDFWKSILPFFVFLHLGLMSQLVKIFLSLYFLLSLNRRAFWKGCCLLESLFPDDDSCSFKFSNGSLDFPLKNEFQKNCRTTQNGKNSSNCLSPLELEFTLLRAIRHFGHSEFQGKVPTEVVMSHAPTFDIVMHPISLK